MSTEHTVARLKELVNHYEDVMRKFRKERLTADSRLQIKKVRRETLEEMISLIKRIS